MSQQNVFWRNLFENSKFILKWVIWNESLWNESFEMSHLNFDEFIEIPSKSVLLSNVIGALIG